MLFVGTSEAEMKRSLRVLESEGFEVIPHRVHDDAAMRKALSFSPPDVILSGFFMPRFDGMRALRLARQLAPQIPFVFVGAGMGDERVVQVMHLGATDVVSTDNLSRLGSCVQRALRHAAQRRQVSEAAKVVGRGLMALARGYALTEAASFDEQAAGYVFESSEGASTPDDLNVLTRRECQVLKLIVDGKSNAEAATILNLSPRSVETYRGRLMKKLGVSDLPALVKLAIRHRITTIS